ncbi:MAG: class I SAM-dependent methyltransferase [Thermodesulfobacteriota bacterium]
MTTGPEPYLSEHYDARWEHSEGVSGEARVPATIALVPREAASVLDLGCGDGTMLSLLPGGLRKTGCDPSFSALKKVAGAARVQAAADGLPFADRSFDLVMLSEVLEHIPEEEYRQSLAEIMRVADRFILISVPFREDLNRKMARCPGCGMVFHLDLHRRSYGPDELSGLFPEFYERACRFSGPREKNAHPLVWKIRRGVGGRYEWQPGTVCPGCGARLQGPPRRSLVSVATSVAAQWTGQAHAKWVSVLFERL